MPRRGEPCEAKGTRAISFLFQKLKLKKKMKINKFQTKLFANSFECLHILIPSVFFNVKMTMIGKHLSLGSVSPIEV